MENNKEKEAKQTLTGVLELLEITCGNLELAAANTGKICKSLNRIEDIIPETEPGVSKPTIISLVESFEIINNRLESVQDIIDCNTHKSLNIIR